MLASGWLGARDVEQRPLLRQTGGHGPPALGVDPPGARPAAPGRGRVRHLRLRGAGAPAAVLAVAASAQRWRRRRRRRAGSRAAVAARRAREDEDVQDVPPPDNLYDLIGVDVNADPGAIKRAYYDKQKICHPDIAGPEGEEMCILLNDAYDVLSKEDSRRAYDEKLSVQSPSSVEEPVDVDTDFSPSWQRAYGDEDPDPYDEEFEEYSIFDARDDVWQGERPPVWSGRPLSASSWDRVDPEGRGGKWQDQRFAYVDPYSCINCHNCVDCAPSTFYIDYFYGKARVHTQWGDAEEDIDWAVMSCPVDCIYWVSREELQYLEFTTAKDLYDNGGEMPNAMLGAVEDPFAKAKQYKERRQRKRTTQATKGLGKLDKMSKKIRAAFARLPAVLRVQGWAKRRSLTQ